jgi:outer membrane lipoprotein SlyB
MLRNRVSVQMKAIASIRQQPKRTRIMLAVVYLAGIVAIAGWAVPREDAAAKRDELATRLPNAGIVETTTEPSTPAREPGSARSRATCAECGVVESVQTIYVREVVIGACTIGDSEETRIPGSLINAAARTGQRPIAATIAGAIVGNRGATTVMLTTRHQVVVRFRDGSRLVLDERTPRTLRVGERIQVIEGATGANA